MTCPLCGEELNAFAAPGETNSIEDRVIHT